MRHDWVIFVQPAKGINDANSADKIKAFFEIARKYNPVNLGCHFIGHMYHNTWEEMMDNVKSRCGTHHAVFQDPEIIKNILIELKERDLGLSVVISGVYEDVNNMCREIGLKPQTVNLSLGVFGKTEKLADTKILELTTMCGHGLISANFVKDMIRKVRNGMEPHVAAVKLTQNCLCAVFNVESAAKKLEELARSDYQTKLLRKDERK